MSEFNCLLHQLGPWRRDQTLRLSPLRDHHQCPPNSHGPSTLLPKPLGQEKKSAFLTLFFFWGGGVVPGSLLCRLFSSCGKQGFLFAALQKFSACRAQVLGCSCFRSCSSQAPKHRLSSDGGMGLAPPLHVGSAWIGAQTHVSCLGRWILYHGATRGDPHLPTFRAVSSAG